MATCFGEVFFGLGGGGGEDEVVFFIDAVVAVERSVGNRCYLDAVGIVVDGFPKGIFQLCKSFARNGGDEYVGDVGGECRKG